MKAFNIWITRKCNLKCKYCYEGINKENRQLSISDIPRLVSFIKKTGEKEDYVIINFHGGEPLLNFKAIVSICEKLSACDMRIYYSITTNGILIDESIIEYIVKYKIFVSVSLDGTPYYHNLNRVDIKGCGTFEKSLEGALTLKDKGIPIRIRMTVTPNNCAEIEKNVRHLQKLGFNNIVAIPDLFNDEWNKDLSSQLTKQLKSLLSTTINKEFIFYEDGIKKKGSCKGGKEEINIDTDLKIYPCTYVCGELEYCVGNVDNGIDRSLIKKIEEEGKRWNYECSGCTLEPYCMSTRCKIINKQLTGNYLSAPPSICFFEHVIYNVYRKSII